MSPTLSIVQLHHTVNPIGIQMNTSNHAHNQTYLLSHIYSHHLILLMFYYLWHMFVIISIAYLPYLLQILDIRYSSIFLKIYNTFHIPTMYYFMCMLHVTTILSIFSMIEILINIHVLLKLLLFSKNLLCFDPQKIYSTDSPTPLSLLAMPMLFVLLIILYQLKLSMETLIYFNIFYLYLLLIYPFGLLGCKDRIFLLL